MKTRRISSGTPWEPVAGSGRAVAAGDYVFASGCTSVRDGTVVHEGDAYRQTAQAIANMAAALGGLGCEMPEVVRTRIYVTGISRWEEYGRAHGEAFGAFRPAAAMVEVSRLAGPRMLAEVEAVAYRPGAATAGGAPGRPPEPVS